MEFSAKQFYVHQRFLNIYYYIYIALENWITNNIFREDKSRVFLASDEYAFRKRFEMTDMSQNYADIDLTHLRFPFANYWPLNSGWKPDTRIAATTAAMIYDGIYEGTTRIRAIPSILSLPTTFYFDREDDARVAYELLYFKSFNEHNYQQEMPFGENTLAIPISMEIKNIQFNPQFKETDWLKQNRIFVIKADMELRSFAIQPPLQPPKNQEVGTDGLLTDGTKYDDGVDRYYLTNEVELTFESDSRYSSYSPLTVPIDQSGMPQESNIMVDQILPIPLDTGTVKLAWIYHEGSQEEVAKITISLDNGLSTREIPKDSTSYIFTALSANSHYRGWLTIYDKRGIPKRFGIDIYTESKPEELEEVPKNTLVGFSW